MCYSQLGGLSGTRLKALQQYIAAAYPTLDATQQAGAQRSGFPHQAIKGWNKMLQ